MGSLDLRAGSRIYVDSQILIYTVERHPEYSPRLLPFWTASRDRQIEIVTSDLTLLEVLVRPLRAADSELQSAYREVLLHSDITLLPVTREILLQAAEIRAALPGLRTPDAIHIATARAAVCDLLLTNDRAFSRSSNPRVVILDDLTR